MKRFLVYILVCISVASCAGGMSREGLDLGVVNSEYIVRSIMESAFKKTVEYITVLNDYIQSVEIDKFKKKSEKHYKDFITQHEAFENELKDLKKVYIKIQTDVLDDAKKKDFEEAVKKVDEAFTSASKAYCTAFRKVNSSLTKLDKTKIAFTDAEVFKSFGKLGIRSDVYVHAMERMPEIVNERCNELTPNFMDDPLYVEVYDKVKKLADESNEISDNFSLTVLSEQELNSIKEGYEKIKTKFSESITALNYLDEELGKRYSDSGVKYDARFKQAIKFLEEVPFRISGFVTPTTISAFIITLTLVSTYWL